MVTPLDTGRKLERGKNYLDMDAPRAARSCGADQKTARHGTRRQEEKNLAELGRGQKSKKTTRKGGTHRDKAQTLKIRYLEAHRGMVAEEVQRDGRLRDRQKKRRNPLGGGEIANNFSGKKKGKTTQKDTKRPRKLGGGLVPVKNKRARKNVLDGL